MSFMPRFGEFGAEGNGSYALRVLEASPFFRV
jgi:hypothetical protein